MSFIANAVSVKNSFIILFLQLCGYDYVLLYYDVHHIPLSVLCNTYSVAYTLGKLKIVFQFPQEPIYVYFVLQTSKIVSSPYAFSSLLGTGSIFFGKCGLDMNPKTHFRTLPVTKICEFALLLLSSSFLSCCRIYRRAVYRRAVYRRAVYRRTVYRRAVYRRAVYRRTVYRRAVYRRAVYRRAVYRRAVYRRAVYRRTVYRRTVYRRAVYRRAVYILLSIFSCK